MKTSTFDYEPADFLPIRDVELCRKIRGITKETICNHESPDMNISIVPEDDMAFRRINDIFHRIKQSDDEDKRLVMILPQPHPQYKKVAYLINKYRVNCRNLYTFNMDEWADQDGNAAPDTWPNGFMYFMKNNFWGAIDESLRPPEDHINGPTEKNLDDYGKMMEDLGGVDVCYGGIGWSGHIAFIEPGSKEFAADTMDEFLELGTRAVTLSPFSIAQSSLDADWGMSGDWSWIPPKGITIGPKEISSARLRSSWNHFTIAGSNVSWQRFSIRMALHGPVTPKFPSTLLQVGKSEVYLSDTVASNIESRHDVSWYS